MLKSQSVNVSMRVNATARLVLKVNFLQEKHVLEMLTLAACVIRLRVISENLPC